MNTAEISLGFGVLAFLVTHTVLLVRWGSTLTQLVKAHDKDIGELREYKDQTVVPAIFKVSEMWRARLERERRDRERRSSTGEGPAIDSG